MRLKKRLGIDANNTTEDSQLEFILEDIENLVQEYCHIEIFPKTLCNLILQMAEEVYKSKKNKEENQEMKIASITIGGTSTSFQTNEKSLKDKLLEDYKSRLNSYRKIRW